MSRIPPIFCQKCGKKLSEIIIINHYKEILEELYSLKEIKIYKWEKNCWKCKKKTPRVSYFIEVNFSYHIGSIQKIDEDLMKKYPFVKKVFSKTMGEEVIANTCIHCNSLLGNWFIGEEIILDIIYEGLDKFLDISIPNTLTLEDLNIKKEDPMFQEYEEIKEFGHDHHITYDPELTIKICPTCHSKIHNSGFPNPLWKQKKEDFQYEKRKKKEKERRKNMKLYICNECNKEIFSPKKNALCPYCKEKMEILPISDFHCSKCSKSWSGILFQEICPRCMIELENKINVRDKMILGFNIFSIKDLKLKKELIYHYKRKFD